MCEIRRAQTGASNTGVQLLVWPPTCLSSKDICISHVVRQGMKGTQGCMVSQDGVFFTSLLKLFYMMPLHTLWAVGEAKTETATTVQQQNTHLRSGVGSFFMPYLICMMWEKTS